MNKEDIEYYENQDIEELVFMCISKDNIIKHLEKRNNELEQDGQDMARELGIRIDKAIEYINNAIYNKEDIFGTILLEILGKDNEKYNASK